ncbi:MAG: hypothetical protein IJ757_02665 [Clostridiales bacterium]|nr:hypothetical protein [Clostridiales bacterium]
MTSVKSIINWCEASLVKAPEGRLKILHQGTSVYFYHVTDNKNPNGKMINQDNQKLITALAQKSYLKTLLRKAREEEKLLTIFLNRYKENSLENIYESCSNTRKTLITPFILPDDEYKEKWLSKEYKRKGFDEGFPIYTTMKGDRVRSKSEQLIADRLYYNNIPYRYEYPLVFDDVVFHPDFTILRMSDRREIYYEHLGRMDDPGYVNKNIRRINIYSNNGLVLGDNLFTTFETGINPLDIRTVDRLIKNCFM